jgi:quercetin dioxygenase-like cupin family protein
VRSWNLNEIATPGGSRSPVVLDSDEAARAVLIGLDPGQELGEHQVKEHAFVLVVDGSVRIETGGESFQAEPGTLFTFEPDERRSVSSAQGARILLFLAPWPGPGHYRGEERAAQPAS